MSNGGPTARPASGSAPAASSASTPRAAPLWTTFDSGLLGSASPPRTSAPRARSNLKIFIEASESSAASAHVVSADGRYALDRFTSTSGRSARTRAQTLGASVHSTAHVTARYGGSATHSFASARLTSGGAPRPSFVVQSFASPRQCTVSDSSSGSAPWRSASARPPRACATTPSDSTSLWKLQKRSMTSQDRRDAVARPARCRSASGVSIASVTCRARLRRSQTAGCQSTCRALSRSGACSATLRCSTTERKGTASLKSLATQV